MVLAKFRQRYPQGSLIGELIDIDRGTYIVRVSAIVANITLATGLAGSDRVEIAEDKARERAIAALGLDGNFDRSAVNLTSSLEAGDRSKENSVSNTLPKPESRVTIPSQSVTSPAVTKPQISVSNNSIKNNEDIPVSNVNSSPEITPQPVYDSPAIDTVAPQVTELIPEPIERSPEPTEPSNLFEGTYNTATVSQDISSETSNVGIATNTPPIKEVAQSQDLDGNEFNKIKHQTDLEITRLGWTREDGMEFLMKHYGKRSRLHLKNEQLIEFLEYLKSQPTPT